jgi:pimeloyl-ACP methyl ester carboxylesterase
VYPSDYNALATSLGAPPQYRGAVISVHGMNTDGAWQKHVSPVLQDALIRHRAVHYGWRRVSAALPRTLDHVAEHILRAYEEQLKHHPTPSAIGHSYGTLSIGHALRTKPDVSFNRIILYGSILSPKYEWDAIHAARRVEAVLNERSRRDFWASIAKWCLPDAGPSGVVGFSEGADFIIDREFPWTRHSGLAGC